MTFIKIMLKDVGKEKAISKLEEERERATENMESKKKALMSLGKMGISTREVRWMYRKNDDSTNSLISFSLLCLSLSLSLLSPLCVFFSDDRTLGHTYFTSPYTYLSQFIVYIYFILCWYRVCIKRPSVALTCTRIRSFVHPFSMQYASERTNDFVCAGLVVARAPSLALVRLFCGDLVYVCTLLHKCIVYNRNLLWAAFAWSLLWAINTLCSLTIASLQHFNHTH